MKFKTFTAEALLAADVNELLMRQVIIQVDNHSERDTIPAPQEGMIVYVDSLHIYEMFDGSGWAPLITSNPACAVGMTGTQSLTTTLTALAFDVDLYDEFGMHSTVTNNTRIYAVKAGLHEVNVTLFNSNTSGMGSVVAQLNGGPSLIQGSFDQRTGLATTACPLHSQFSVVLAVGDYIEIQVSHTTAAGTIAGGTNSKGAICTMKNIG